MAKGPGTVFFFFNDTATTEIYTLSLHDALPIYKRGDQTAIIWEGDDPSQSKHITYKQLHDEVCRMANILRTRKVKKRDRVTIYLPLIPEAAYAMLACERIGAIHSVVFAALSPHTAAQRITAR